MQATVGSKYQIVIPKQVRKSLKTIRPGSKVTIHQIDENTITIQTSPAGWVERTRGMMTEAWKGIDTTAELEKMKDEWEERLKSFEKGIK